MLTTLLLACLAAPTPELALAGLDPVHLCWGWERTGSEQWTETVGRYTYQFASEKTRELFLENPERWGIQWAGGCARMGPLSGAGSPDRFAVYSDRIYIFASDGCRDGFLSAPERFVTPAWHPVLLRGVTEAVAAALPTPSMEERASDLLAAAVVAHGGTMAIDSLQALRLGFIEERDGWVHGVKQVVGRDGTLQRASAWSETDADEEPTVTAWTLQGPASVDEGDGPVWISSPDFIADLRRYLHREPLFLLWARNERGFRAHVAVTEQPVRFGSRRAYEVIVSYQGARTRLFLDPDSRRIVGLSWRGRLNDGVTREIVERFTEFREVEGVLVPIAREVEIDGELASRESVTWSEVALER